METGLAVNQAYLARWVRFPGAPLTSPTSSRRLRHRLRRNRLGIRRPGDSGCRFGRNLRRFFLLDLVGHDVIEAIESAKKLKFDVTRVRLIPMTVERLSEERNTLIELKKTLIGTRQTLIELKKTLIGMRQTLIELKKTLIGMRQTLIGMRQTLIESKKTLIGTRGGHLRFRSRMLGKADCSYRDQRQTSPSSE